jgi:hypothetical protein
MPEHAQKLARECTWSGVNEINVLCGAIHNQIYGPGCHPLA